MEFYDIEEIIIAMAEIVYENRRLRKENKELREYKEKQYKFMTEQVSQNFKTSAELINVLLKKENNENEKD